MGSITSWTFNLFQRWLSRSKRACGALELILLVRLIDSALIRVAAQTAPAREQRRARNMKQSAGIVGVSFIFLLRVADQQRVATDPCTGARLHDRLMAATVVLALVLELMLELALSARHQRSHEGVGGLFGVFRAFVFSGHHLRAAFLDYRYACSCWANRKRSLHMAQVGT